MLSAEPGTETLCQNSSRSFGNRLQGAREARLGPRHPDVVPHDAAELAVNLADAAAPLTDSSLLIWACAFCAASLNASCRW
jgi:hypothetical protein